MDPNGYYSACRHPGFPRPRGDGPADRLGAAVHHGVSPPTRGWTTTTRRCSCGTRGFPAHAGMDRGGRRWPITWMRFPRPRGDGPCAPGAAGCPSWVSPPTRGWTRHHEAGREGDAGFPAHAGMDPVRRHRPRPAVRFPRPRGDGPHLVDPRHLAGRVSPPTRGWTLLRLYAHVRKEGFPAHAGMDRRDDAVLFTFLGFPRPRGDGPPCSCTAGASPRVSPPTRGWTAPSTNARNVTWGFPAHAGMDPARWPPAPASRRFPRPRGDGPPTLTRQGR